jgi:hypothetical protein
MAPQSRSLRVVFTEYLDQKEFVYMVVEPGRDDPGRCPIKAGVGGENGLYNRIVDIKEDSLKFPLTPSSQAVRVHNPRQLLVGARKF